uniref:Uncharacterized protein n=1 Tax=Arundo donax TaxID=35708 RepID=A0A0A8ZSN3_ARUDO
MAYSWPWTWKFKSCRLLILGLRHFHK